MPPIRVVCQNTLNLALDSAKRIWTTKHTKNAMSRVHEARETLMLAETYMGELGRGIDTLSKIRLTDKKVMEFMQEFFPVGQDVTEAQRKNNLRLLEDMKMRYWDAPDLSNVVYLRELGARPVSKVSKRTDFLIIGDRPGSKLDKALTLGIPILSEQEFEVMAG